MLIRQLLIVAVCSLLSTAANAETIHYSEAICKVPWIARSLDKKALRAATVQCPDGRWVNLQFDANKKIWQSTGWKTAQPGIATILCPAFALEKKEGLEVFDLIRHIEDCELRAPDTTGSNK